MPDYRLLSPFLVLACFARVHAAQVSIEGIGAPAGAVGTYPLAVAANTPTVTGYVYWGGSPEEQHEAFSWSSQTGIRLLGDLAGGNLASEGRAISPDGRLVAGKAGNGARAWGTVWMDGVGPTVVTSDFWLFINGMTPDGTSMVGGGGRAMRWTSDSGESNLGDLPGGRELSAARGVSADGQTIVGLGSSASGFEAFRWTAATGMVGLGTLGGSALWSEANAISADGSTIVGFSSTAAGYEAFKYREDTGMVALGDLPGGAVYANARSTTADGSIVVGLGSGPGPAGTQDSAFYWSSRTGMIELSDYLTDTYGLDLSGWVLSEATAISPDGLYIVGRGVHNGRTEGFIVVLPDPGTGIGFFVACVLAVRRRGSCSTPVGIDEGFTARL